MNAQIIALGSYAAAALGSYIIIALRERFVAIINPLHTLDLQRMQWICLILAILWFIVAMLLPGIMFLLTKNPLSFVFLDAIAPPTSVLIYNIKIWKKRMNKPVMPQ